MTLNLTEPSILVDFNPAELSTKDKLSAIKSGKWIKRIERAVKTLASCHDTQLYA